MLSKEQKLSGRAQRGKFFMRFSVKGEAIIRLLQKEKAFVKGTGRAQRGNFFEPVLCSLFFRLFFSASPEFSILFFVLFFVLFPPQKFLIFVLCKEVTEGLVVD